MNSVSGLDYMKSALNLFRMLVAWKGRLFAPKQGVALQVPTRQLYLASSAPLVFGFGAAAAPCASDCFSKPFSTHCSEVHARCSQREFPLSRLHKCCGCCGVCPARFQSVSGDCPKRLLSAKLQEAIKALGRLWRGGQLVVRATSAPIFVADIDGQRETVRHHTARDMRWCSGSFHCWVRILSDDASPTLLWALLQLILVALLCPPF